MELQEVKAREEELMLEVGLLVSAPASEDQLRY